MPRRGKHQCREPTIEHDSALAESHQYLLNFPRKEERDTVR